MMIRNAIVAGQFYPAEANACREAIEQHLGAVVPLDRGGLCLAGGLVPHAGWTCSGTVAAGVFAALAKFHRPDVIVLFGGVHRYRGSRAAVFGSGRWSTPLGPVNVDSRLAERILQNSNLFLDDSSAHESEHSLEVQVPLIRYLFPDVKVVPIMVPIDPSATQVGEAVGQVLHEYSDDGLIVGTTDLTHYGPRYGFTPQGVGAEANAWAKSTNDRRFVDLVCSLAADALVPEAASHRNACNSGAAAATVSATVSLGARRGVLLEQTTSCEVLSRMGDRDQANSVGYAGIVFEK